MKLLLTSLAIAGSTVAADELKPLSYTVETNYIRYERTTNYITLKENTNMIIGFETESTNWPASIIHSVTWGRGTNRVFVLKTCEPLPKMPETNGWRNAEWTWYNAATWIESVK